MTARGDLIVLCHERGYIRSEFIAQPKPGGDTYDVLVVADPLIEAAVSVSERIDLSGSEKHRDKLERMAQRMLEKLRLGL